jgi:hypothetical protein
MSKYNGLDKVNLAGLTLSENYRGCKIYKDVEGGYVVVKRGYEIDSQILNIEFAKQVADHFQLD